MRRTAGYTWTDYKTNTQNKKELKITPILDKLLEYKRNWIQRVNRMPRNRLPRVMKHYFPTGRRNHGRPLKILLETWNRNGSTTGPTPWQIYDDDNDDDDADEYRSLSSSLSSFLHSPVTSSLLGRTILLSTLFPNTLSLSSSLNVSDQFSHP